MLGYPLAYAIAFKAGRWKNLMLVLVIAPFFTSFLVRTLSWKLILADNGFVVNTLQCRAPPRPRRPAAGDTDRGGRRPDLQLPAVHGAAAVRQLEKIDHRLIEAASDLYASPFTGFRKVTLPLSLPGVVAGTLLTFIPAAGDYINAELLGSPNQRMVGNVIQSLFTDGGNYPAAAALSVILMLLIVAMVLFYVRRAGTEELL